MFFQGRERFGNTSHHVRVAAVEADSDIVEVHGADKFNQPLGRGKFVGNVLNQHAHAERFGESAQVLDGGHRRFELLFVKCFVGIADVLHQKTEWNKFSNFQGALDLVHVLDSSRPVGGGD